MWFVWLIVNTVRWNLLLIESKSDFLFHPKSLMKKIESNRHCCNECAGPDQKESECFLGCWVTHRAIKWSQIILIISDCLQ